LPNIIVIMAPSNNKKGGGGSGEIQVNKSPAEFFAEHQAIAGFDNLGKSLYTSIRELIENSLDACEAIGVLPHIQIELLEYTQTEFNHQYVGDSPRRASKDTDLFKHNKQSTSKKDEQALKKKEDAYFKLAVTDNGCGMEVRKGEGECCVVFASSWLLVQPRDRDTHVVVRSKEGDPRPLTHSLARARFALLLAQGHSELVGQGVERNQIRSTSNAWEIWFGC